ncbi:hypothetical protein EJ04DRAFT_458421 [Polyplosphaeria fusca]|uniref:Uncharacterized protein n=1 Tax=Polyplosphaeria fusca TaxID=682080 RepID=A0A9P4V3Z4_9PLEO|nr:hypothetical protein EJ04DRAFT_458421 [Polyplosphaeria fusca]
MLPALQPSRPKLQPSSQHSYQHQQKRAIQEQRLPPSSPGSHQPPKPTVGTGNAKPRNQIEAMPPLVAGPFFPLPPRNLYDSAIRHPVFFTDQLRKPPFPIPEMPCQGWSPVASGYVLEQKRDDRSGSPRTKL